MDKIWAPWRAPYIRKISRKEKGCIFCRALKSHQKKKDSAVIEVSHRSFSILNIFPYNNGHLMVAPKRHVGAFSKLTPAELADIMTLLQRTERSLKQVMKPHGFNIGLNLGRQAGAGITQHLHFHIVPRWAGDTNFFPLFSGTKVISESLEAVKDRLRKNVRARKK